MAFSQLSRFERYAMDTVKEVDVRGGSGRVCGEGIFNFNQSKLLKENRQITQNTKKKNL